MKKIFLILTMILMLSCILAVTIGAEVTTYDDAPVRTKIQVSTDDVVVFSDGFTCPSAYVFIDQTYIPDGSHSTTGLSKVLDFKYINEKTKNNYGISNVVEIDIPEGVTTIGTFVCYGLTGLKRISIPYSVTSVGAVGFQNATGLEECVFENGGNPKLKELGQYMFSNCSSLKAFSMPDSITSMSGEGSHFTNCISLTALHLSSSLTTISWTKGGSVFDQCGKLYLVNEAFTTSDTAPEKPKVYYFPENLANISNDCMFRNCKSLNDVLVFGKATTKIENKYFFQSSPANTVVFLGDIVSVNVSYWGTSTLYFANVNDVDATSAGISGSKTIYYCNAQGNTSHLAEKTVFEEAGCEVNAGNATYCFCGYQISKDDIEGTALSHDHDYVNGKATLISINYDDISKDGTKTIKCGLCGKSSEITVNKIFDYKGYSKKENNNRAVCVGYFIDYNALSEYETFTDVDYTYGFVAAANNDTPLDENANAGNNVIKTDLSESKFTSVEFILTAKDWTVGAASEAKLSINMYIIIDGAVKYITASGLSDIAEAKVYAEI